MVAAGCGESKSATSPSPPPSNRTFLSFTVETGFGLRSGQSVELTPDNATFSGYGSYTSRGETNAVQVTARDATGATWGIWLAAPDDRPLLTSRYPSALNSFQRPAASPGLTFWNTTIGGCPQATGEFTVLDAAFSPTIPPTAGTLIDRLHATFEQRCVFNGQTISAVRGEVNIPATLR